ncbi:nifu-like protein [Zygosaccharomyces mellis]|uniref:Nifu-like protein n=1 Tax=Zygosaccharomyces mellis TaxID=42258 RepID=A0A4C2E6B3_9SACH|nr:nifu-like protein [Zygosaccharomyces mellis]
MFRIAGFNVTKTLKPNMMPMAMPRRLIAIKTMTTPNENALKFISTDGEMLQDSGSSSLEIKNSDESLIEHSKLAQRIFLQCPGVESLMIGDNFLTVNKDSMVHWNQIKPGVIELLTSQLASGENIVSDEFHTIKDADNAGYEVNAPKFELSEEDEEVSDMIDELIQTRIRPAIQDDGGDIQYRAYDPKTGTVYLKLQGACKSCSSSEDTLKAGIEGMLKHYVEEVTNVVQILDPEEEIALREFDKMEQKIQQKHAEQ